MSTHNICILFKPRSSHFIFSILPSVAHKNIHTHIHIYTNKNHKLSLDLSKTNHQSHKKTYIYTYTHIQNRELSLHLADSYHQPQTSPGHRCFTNTEPDNGNLINQHDITEEPSSTVIHTHRGAKQTNHEPIHVPTTHKGNHALFGKQKSARELRGEFAPQQNDGSMHDHYVAHVQYNSSPSDADAVKAELRGKIVALRQELVAALELVDACARTLLPAGTRAYTRSVHRTDSEEKYSARDDGCAQKSAAVTTSLTGDAVCVPDVRGLEVVYVCEDDDVCDLEEDHTRDAAMPFKDNSMNLAGEIGAKGVFMSDLVKELGLRVGGKLAGVPVCFGGNSDSDEDCDSFAEGDVTCNQTGSAGLCMLTERLAPGSDCAGHSGAHQPGRENDSVTHQPGRDNDSGAHQPGRENDSVTHQPDRASDSGIHQPGRASDSGIHQPGRASDSGIHQPGRDNEDNSRESGNFAAFKGDSHPHHGVDAKQKQLRNGGDDEACTPISAPLYVDTCHGHGSNDQAHTRGMEDVFGRSVAREPCVSAPNNDESDSDRGINNTENRKGAMHAERDCVIERVCEDIRNVCDVRNLSQDRVFDQGQREDEAAGGYVSELKCVLGNRQKPKVYMRKVSGTL
jgi:hypothetical protein